MKRTQSFVSSLIAGALVFGSLGVSGFVGAVATLADEDGTTQKSASQSNDPVQAPIGPKGLLARSNRSSKDADLSTSRQRLGVRLSKDGIISGRLNVSDSITGAHVAAEKLNVRFIQRGSIVTEVKPGPGGVFQVTGLNPGVYSMIANGADGFFACAVIVSPYAGEAELGTQESLQIDASVVHPSNVAVVQKLIHSRASASGKPAQRRIQAAQASNNTASADDAPPLNTPVLAVGADGRVLARINDVDAATAQRNPAAGATVYMVQRGVVRGRYQVGEDGSFYAPGLVGGQYSLVATSLRSQNSFAAIGVIVEEAGASSSTVNRDSRVTVRQVKVTRAQGGSDIDMIPTTDFDSTADPSTTTDQQAAGGGFAGGTGGGAGGGGGFGGGGLGLAAIGLGAAGLAAALANQNNNNNNNAASPKK